MVRLGLMLAMLLAACGGAEPTCAACSVCPGATEIDYFPEYGDMYCFCSTQGGDRVMAIPAPVPGLPDVTALSGAICVSDKWTTLVAASGGACDATMGPGWTTFGQRVCAL